jgi:hypothetical protein
MMVVGILMMIIPIPEHMNDKNKYTFCVYNF